MEITVREGQEATIITLSGRLDLAAGSNLKQRIKELLDLEKTAFHFNLSGVEFINSSGLGCMVSVMKEIRLRRGRLTLSNLAAYVHEIFEITQLTHIFEIFPTEEEALKSYQPVTV